MSRHERPEGAAERAAQSLRAHLERAHGDGLAGLLEELAGEHELELVHRSMHSGRQSADHFHHGTRTRQLWGEAADISQVDTRGRT